MCFVWIWEQTAIISLYTINWLVFMTETECVYCAVRTGSINMTKINLSLWVACVAPRRLAFDPESVCVRFVVGEVALGLGFLLLLRFPRVSINSTNAPYWSLSTRWSYQKHKQAKSGDFPRSNAVPEIAEHWTEKCCRLVFSGMTLTREDRNTRRKACPIATTNPHTDWHGIVPEAPRWQACGRTVWTFQKQCSAVNPVILARNVVT